ncbi:helix-turn-helix domain-containing protein [Streptomyces sp. NPDC001406]|uniref:helix-turn-helix domain-containing protein n=1 Tax=Streptomyces sp. NPDC001406 TaxID=3364572 RepID=UPI0036CD5F9B
MHQVNSKLRNARLRLGLTTVELAARCTAEGADVDNSQISRYERGINAPRDPRVRVVLARILGVDAATDFGPNTLIGESGEGAA